MLQFDDRTIRIIDTPGLFDTKTSEDRVLLELAKTLETFPNGVHAFIYVLNGANSRFTEEEQKTLHKIKVLVMTMMTPTIKALFTRTVSVIVFCPI